MRGVTSLIVQTMTNPERRRFERLQRNGMDPDEAAQVILLDRPRLEVNSDADTPRSD